MSNEHPILETSFKQRFPFRLSVPSFIYPADYVANVERLGPYVDEIEFLLFESKEESLPSPAQISTLASLSQRYDFSYNVHLPLDIDLGTADQNSNRKAVEQLVHIVELVQPLSPSTHTLHLNCHEKDHRPEMVDSWQNRTAQSLIRLLQALPIPSRCISIETLDYPPQWFAPLVDQLDLSVCVDVGHVFRFGFEIHEVLKQFYHRITILHLHGVENGKDHLALDKLPLDRLNLLQPYLQRFRGVVSLEVFSFDRLQDSLTCLTDIMSMRQPEVQPDQPGKAQQ